MSKVFWFTGRPGAGKTTLTKKLESHLKDEIKILTIDGDEIRSEIKSNLGILTKWYFCLLKRKMTNLIIKNVCEKANKYSQSGVNVFIATSANRKRLDYAKEQFDGRYIEIYLKCSMEYALKRRPQFKNSIKFFEESKFPNIIIDTEHQSVEESFQTLLHFIEKEQVFIDNKMS